LTREFRLECDQHRLTSRFVGVIRRYQFRMKPHGLGGWVWWLSMAWLGIGAALSGFTFLTSIQPVTVSSDGIPTWLGGPGSANMIWAVEAMAAATLLILTVPVLLAGLTQLRSLIQPLWAGAWVVGLPLMVLTKVWADNLPERTTCGADGCGVAPYSGPAVVNLRELAICAAFLALGAVMTWILAGPESVSRRQFRPGSLAGH
jgi:hypothetical protein